MDENRWEIMLVSCQQRPCRSPCLNIIWAQSSFNTLLPLICMNLRNHLNCRDDGVTWISTNPRNKAHVWNGYTVHLNINIVIPLFRNRHMYNIYAIMNITLYSSINSFPCYIRHYCILLWTDTVVLNQLVLQPFLPMKWYHDFVNTLHKSPAKVKNGLFYTSRLYPV